MSVFQRNENLEGFIKNYPVNSVLVFLMTLVYIVTFFGRFFGYSIISLGGLIPVVVDIHGEYYRMFTVMFIHGGIMHFLFNTFFGLVILGAALEKILGSVKYLIVFFVSGLGSSVAVYFFSAPNTLTVGASGAIYGALGVFLYIILFRKRLLSFQDRQLIRNLILINLVITFLLGRISIEGHIGGLVTGFLLAFLLGIKETHRSGFYQVYYG